MPKVFFAENLRYLIKRQRVTNAIVAKVIGNNSQSITDYLSGKSKPKFEGLVQMAEFFNVSLDDLVYRNLAANDIEVDGEIITLEQQKNYLVPVRAHAGYVAEWGQGHTKGLERVHIPWVFGEARTWEIEGDSMAPLLFPGDMVSGVRANINTLFRDAIYVLVTKSQGIHVKFLELEREGITLRSINPNHKPYVMPFEEIREIWNVQVRITRRITDLVAQWDGKEYKWPVVRVERGEDQ